MQILIVEPSESVGSMLKTLLEAKGHAVETAVTGERALEIARARPPEVILLDVALPGEMDGLALCRRIREETGPEGAAQFVVLSADGSEDARERAAEVGVRAFYTKPVSPVALLKEIESLRVRASTPRLPTSAADDD